MESIRQVSSGMYAERAESISPIFDIAHEVAQEIGNTPETRESWLLDQDSETLKKLLILINKNVREDPDMASFDGEDVQAGAVGLGIIPPDAEDKLELFEQIPKLLAEKKEQDVSRGISTQQTVEEMIGSVSIFLNQLHLFADGNGRTTRLLKTVLRKGGSVSLADIEATILKIDANEITDTSPRAVVKQAVLNEIRKTSLTDTYEIFDDVATDADFLDSTSEGISIAFPNMPASIVSMYKDNAYFVESVARLCKEKGIEPGQVKLSEILTMCTEDPEVQENLHKQYRQIRKEVALVSFKASLGLPDISLFEKHKKIGEINVRDYNRNRASLG